ncbi:hypothetical protein M9458_005288, partial [Cirrhinus mrigala]
VLTSVVGHQLLDEEGLQTLFCEVEAILNDRPITKVSEDPNDLEALTPNHILPPGLFEKSDLYIKRRWRQVQYVAELFWKRGSWMMGRVLSTTADSRGLVRSVKVQTKTSILDRPITKLCLLLEANN